MPQRARTNSRTRSSHLTVIGAICAGLNDAEKQVRIGELMDPRDAINAFAVADRHLRQAHAALQQQVLTLQRRHNVVIPDEFFKPLEIAPRLSVVEAHDTDVAPIFEPKGD